MPKQDDTHQHFQLTTHMVPMRDGVRLATDVYRPASLSPDAPLREALPVLLHRTPYSRVKSARTEKGLLPDGTLTAAMDMTDTAERFARRGYVCVVQDCRGRYDSEGRFIKYVREGDDGVDTLAWLLQQPWCNGKVGMFGLSYCAHVQVSAACLHPPGLACMFLESGGFWDAFEDGSRCGGAFTMKQVTWAFKNAKVSPEVMSKPDVKAAMEAIDLKAWFADLASWRQGHSPLSLAPEYESYIYHDWEAKTLTDEWKQCGLYAKGFLDQISDVPTLIICSWYDPYIGAMTEMYNALTATKKGPIRMILGPWTHGDHAIPYAGHVDFGPQSTFDRNVAPTFQGARAEWFDEWLYGDPAEYHKDGPADSVNGASAPSPLGGAAAHHHHSKSELPHGATAEHPHHHKQESAPQSILSQLLKWEKGENGIPFVRTSSKQLLEDPDAFGRKGRRPFASPVQYFRMGGGTGLKTDAGRLQHGGMWLMTNSWPPAVQAEPYPFYLRSGRSLLPEPEEDGEASVSWRSDPRDPVPTIGGNITSGEPMMVGGAFDQVEGPSFFGCSDFGRRLCDRPDVVSFASAPLIASADVTGNATVMLFASSDCPTTDFCVTLVDEYPVSELHPDGFSMNIASGISRVTFPEPPPPVLRRDSVAGSSAGGAPPLPWGSVTAAAAGMALGSSPDGASAPWGDGPVPRRWDSVAGSSAGGASPTRGEGDLSFFMDDLGAAVAAAARPRQIVEVVVKLNTTSNLFKKGHVLRIDVASSCYPRYDLNWQGGDDPALRRTAHNRIHMTPAHQSRLMLPIAFIDCPDDEDLEQLQIPFNKMSFGPAWLKRAPSWRA